MHKNELRFDAPCTLDWRKMTPAEGGRFCGDCKKVVRDLTKMTETDARALLAKPRNEGLCVRMAYDAQGRVLFEGMQGVALIPPTLLSRAKRAAVAAAAIAAPLATQACTLTNALTGGGPDPEPQYVMGDVAYEGDGGPDLTFGDGGGDAGDAAADATPDASPDADADGGADAAPDALPPFE